MKDSSTREVGVLRTAGAAVAIAAGAVIFVLTTPGSSVNPEPAAPAASTAPTMGSTLVPDTPPAGEAFADGAIFGETTGVLLLFDNGLEGLIAVDPDRALMAGSQVEGQRAGDEPYSMIQVADKLVVGWGEPRSVDLATREGRSLGSATIFVPAAEPDRVWMVDYGARIGSNDPEVWQMNVVTGVPLGDPVSLDAEGHPEIGIPGGLALQRDVGLDLWEMETGETTSIGSDGPGFVHDVRGDEMVWCSGDCSRLAVTDTSNQKTEEFDSPEEYSRFLPASRISPNGRYLASLVGLESQSEERAIWILDRETGRSGLASDPASEVDYLAWSPDGDQLFASSWSYGLGETALWRYRVSDGEFTAVNLPFGGALSLVVVDSSVADAYIAR